MPRKTIYVSKETKELEGKIRELVLKIIAAKGKDYILDVYNQSALYRTGLLLLSAHYSKELELTYAGYYDSEDTEKEEKDK